LFRVRAFDYGARVHRGSARCEALDLPRRHYDETLSGSRGFRILVVPGVIHLWHQGAKLPLLNPLPIT
jgi:hypothetical protein